MKTKTICIFLATGLALLLCPGVSAKPAAAKPPAASASSFPWSRSRRQDKAGFYFQPAGLCEDYPEVDRTQARLDRDFQVLRWAGVRLLRVGIAWESIERTEGQYNWTFWDRLVRTAAQNHVTLIPYVCYAPEWAAAQKKDFWKQPPADPQQFGAFMRVIAARYKGRVHSWELWNEPDNPDFWLGNVAGYANLVRAGAEGVRLADPSDAVILGGLADGDSAFGRTLLRQYRVGRDVGAVNFHGYDETWNRKPLEDYPREIVGLSRAVGSSASRPDVWMAEFGYSSLQPPAGGYGGEAANAYDYQHTADYQASVLFKCHVLALSTGRLSLTAWYRINDLQPTTEVIGDSENRFLGVMDAGGRPKPALGALKFYNALLGQPVRCLDNAVKSTLPAHSEAVLHVFEQKGGKIVVVGWLRAPAPVPGAPQNSPDTRSEEVSLMLPAGVSSPVAAYALDGDRVPTRAALTGRVLSHIVLSGAKPFITTIKFSQKASKE